MVFNPRVGVYICHCGINIASTIDVPAVTEYAAGLPGVTIARNYTYMCSEPGQRLIQQDIVEHKLNRVVVASCSPRMHEITFRTTIAEAGLNPYLLEMANIREQCSWVHASGMMTTQKAMQLVASATAKAVWLESLELRKVSVIPSVLVIGGGVAGMQAALDVAEAGFHAILVERAAALGGMAAHLECTFPTLEPAGALVQGLVERVQQHPHITLLLETEVTEIKGYVGNFQVLLWQKDKAIEELAGAIIVATGYDVFDAGLKPELGYGVYPQVITTLDFERMAAAGAFLEGRTPKQVVFIQCVGSRDDAMGSQGVYQTHPYCSRICCMVTAKQARRVREKLPAAQVTVLYMDIRAYGKGFEEFYDQTRESGVVYRRCNPAEILRRGEKVVVRAEDTFLGELIELEADLVVLAVGMTPRADTPAMAGLLKLSRSADGFFLEAHPKLRPVDTAMAGVFLAGCCQGPKDISEAITQARAAASAALIPILRGEVQVEAATSFVDEEMCSGCGQCESVCAYSALSLHPRRGVMTVNPVLCQGCGACSAACPSGAINVHQATFQQVMAQVEALMV